MTVAQKVCFACLVCLFLFGPAAPRDASAITVQEELKLSKEFMEYIRHEYKIVEDPYVTRYMNDLGQKLLEGFAQQPFTFHFYVVQEDVYNAFAGPGGNIFIHSGLIEAMEDESELAGILVHEISHVTCRHISKYIDRSGKIQIGTMAGVLAAILVGANSSGEAATTLMAGSLGAGQSITLAYSREDEEQADEVGIKALTQAGYTVDGILTMLKKIKATDFSSDTPSYMKSHPELDARIVYLSRHLNSKTPPSGQAPPPGDNFRRVHTRILAAYGDRLTAKKTFQAIAEDQPSSFLPDYGFGLLAFRDGDRTQAKAYLKKAIEKQAFDPYLLSELGQYYFLDGNYPVAENVLKSSVSLDSANPESRSLLGQTRMALGDYAAAERIFTQLTVDMPDYSKALYYLGETYNKQSRFAEAYYYLGEYYTQTGDHQKAAFNLRRARKESSAEELRKKIEEALKEAERQEEAEREGRDPDEEDDEGNQDTSFSRSNAVEMGKLHGEGSPALGG